MNQEEQIFLATMTLFAARTQGYVDQNYDFSYVMKRCKKKAEELVKLYNEL